MLILHGKPCLLIPVMKVSMQNKILVESKTYKTITMTGKRKFSFGVLTHSSSIGQEFPKAMELLKCYFHCLVAMPVQHAKRPKEKHALPLRPTCVQNRFCNEQNLARTNHLPVCELHFSFYHTS